VGADELLPDLLETAGTLIADKAYDARERVIEPLEKAGVDVVIPPRGSANDPCDYDRERYKRRHLIENFSTV